MAKTLNATNSASLTAENTFTTPDEYNGFFSLRIRGTWSGTVTLQRSDDRGTSWDDVEAFTGNSLRVVLEPAQSGATWRLGFKTGEYSSGTAEVQLA